ncbi:MAG: amidohydrolase family protein [Candidatus Thiodiazotropha sp. (ex Dulcina madagascariensis)]|nr:amidohydrolase family protein [Candidatus Thiodiazotropha sp. (ex Dulcina madagascariensis)]
MPNDAPLFDAHFHIIDDAYPLVANQGYLPEAFTCDDYLERMEGRQLVGGAVVSGSFQGFDQGCLLAALRRLGEGFVGVTQLPAGVDDTTLEQLHQAGVRAVRFNLLRGGSEAVSRLDGFARRVHERLGWHVELYLDAQALEHLYPVLESLPAVCIDHLGLSLGGQRTLLRLVEQGVRVKACGFGRVDFDLAPVLRDLYAANPHSLMFGTDLPSTRAPRPYQESDMALVREALSEDGARRVCCENALAFYRLAGLMVS